MGLGLVFGIGASLVDAFGPEVSPLAFGGGILTLGVITLWLSYRWWVGVDEAVREAHKFSWFWGGSAGLVIVIAIAVALAQIAGGSVGQLGLSPTEAGLIATGISITVGLMLIGYGLCWAGWWLLRSR